MYANVVVCRCLRFVVCWWCWCCLMYMFGDVACYRCVMCYVSVVWCVFFCLMLGVVAC